MIKIKKDNINLKATLLSGQCFRVKEENDSSFTIILEDRVVNLKEKCRDIVISSNNNDNLQSVISSYLNLDRDYKKINTFLLQKDSSLKEVLKYSQGYKILKQPKFEIIISYIISQNNTVKNISNCIEKISYNFGKKVLFNNKEYYLFPTLEELCKLNENDFKNCSVGFRSKYIVNMLDKIKSEKYFLKNIENLSSEEGLNELMNIKGIGLKVASCILMFGYGRLDVFPIDTWVKKYLNKTNEKVIKNEINKKYGKYSGLIIQYMFHYMRNKKVL